MKYSLALSIIFCVCGLFYLVFGSNITAANVRSRINRIFVYTTSSLTAWSFARAISVSAPTAQESAFWQSFSVVGWGTFYSLLLHFVITLTGFKSRLNNKIIATLIYFPALINLILFSPLGILGPDRFQMVPTDFGWISIHPFDMAEKWLVTYYAVFMTLSFFIFFRWWLKLEPNTPLKRAATVFTKSTVITFIVAAILELLPRILKLNAPPKANFILMLIPVTTLYFTYTKSGQMLEKSREVVVSRESKELLEQDRLRLFQTVTTIFTTGSALSLMVGYFGMKKPLAGELVIAGFLLLMGIFSRFIPILTKNHSLQNTMFLMVCTASLIYIMNINAATGALTIWAIYILFLMFTVILYSRVSAIIYTGLLILIQVGFWIILPEVPVVIDANAYMTRIIIIALSAVGIRYLTTEYAAKIEAYKSFAREQEVLEIISSNFITFDLENAKDKVDEMLEVSAEILEFNHAYLVEFTEGYEEVVIRNSFLRDCKRELFPYYNGMRFKTDCLMMAQQLIAQDEPIIYGDIKNASDDIYEKERNSLLARGINSFFAFPIKHDGRIIGTIVTEYYEPSSDIAKESRLYFLRMLVNLLSDAKKKTAQEEMLYFSAYFDPNTKLPNRNMLIRKLDESINTGEESEKIVVFNIELENLRMIKDSFGHDIGEQVVIQSAKILENLTDCLSYIARAGERDFALVLQNVESTEQIRACAEKLLDAFDDPISTDAGVDSLFVFIRIGVSVYPDQGKDAVTLLKNADLAGYEAQRINERVVFYTEQLESRTTENTIFTNRLFESLQNDEFFLEFQPQISCQTGKVAGVEALIRWSGDESMEVAPDRFVPILEQTGLIYDVGLWVLKQALKEHNRLIKKGFPPLRFSVNLSLVQFLGEHFIADFARVIEESKVDPQYIELEITESFFSENPDDVIEKLHGLREMGVKIAIDDFGGGYSSLNRLKSIPFDRIKIDKKIIDYINTDEKMTSLTEIIILLSRTFMVNVTAEGVETKEQADFLKSKACDEIQGYYFSKPLPSEALEEYLKVVG